MVKRLQQKRYRRTTGYWLRAALLTGALLLLLFYVRMNDAMPNATTLPFNQTVKSFGLQWYDILSMGFYRLQGVEPPHPVKRPLVDSPSLLRYIVLLFTEVDITDSRSLLSVKIPTMALWKESQHSAVVRPRLNPISRKLTPVPIPSKPLVGIYHTHTSESFLPNSGVTHAPGGQRGDIIAVGEAMVERFAKHGISAIQNTDIHDYPSFMRAYNKSENAVKQMNQEFPSLQALFDIHRNAGVREETTTVIEGVAVARVLFIVGKGQEGLEQPQWEQNLTFAKAIDAKLNQNYPGVSLGVDVVEWRYNQHLHPHALLLEMGCQHNTKEEVIHAIEIIADVVTELLAN
ncbi:MAG: stage II sporulation protein P [Sporomusaceae bacterium]|nr:stage II sporulation protein P [Sporomusaceae bacterium]